MKRTLAGLVLLAAARAATADIVITEIHYNPSGGENGNQEWIEIYNTADVTVDLSGWDWGDSQDNSFNADFAPGTLLAPKSAAILAAQTSTTFGQIWGGGIQVIQSAISVTPAFSLANGATATNELIVLRDAADNVVDEVNYQNALEGWPDDNNLSSIYLRSDAISRSANDIGTNWALSTDGVERARIALIINPDITTNNPGLDIASPGVVLTQVPEPASLFVLPALACLLRRRRVSPRSG